MGTPTVLQEFEESTSRKMWSVIWKIFPEFSARHSPFKLIPGFGTLWSRGLGEIAVISQRGTAIVAWSLGDGTSVDRIFHLSGVVNWETSGQTVDVTDSDRAAMRSALLEIYQNKKRERLIFQ